MKLKNILDICYFMEVPKTFMINFSLYILLFFCRLFFLSFYGFGLFSHNSGNFKFIAIMLAVKYFL